MSTVFQQSHSSSMPNMRRTNCWLLAVLVPLIAAPLWLAIASVVPAPFLGISRLLLILVVLVSAATDISCRKIYNWTTYSAVLWAIAINVLPASIVGANTIGLYDCLVGASVCFLVMLVPYTLARGGAGDVKLAAAIGAFVGMDAGLLVIAFAYIIAAISILSWSIWNRGPVDLVLAMFRQIASVGFPESIAPPNEQQKLVLDQPVPLAGFFLIATLLVVFDVPVLLGGF